jgi:hypothetical protein
VAEAQAFIPVETNVLVERAVAETIRDPFSESDYKQLLLAVKARRSTVTMGGHKMVIRMQQDGRIVLVKRADGGFAPMGSLEVERLHKEYG